MQPTGLLETGDLFFALKEVSYTPKKPKMKEPFSVKGKVDLLKIPFLAPCWIIATVTYPEKWWEEIIPIIGAPEVRETDIALGGDFEVLFPKGFDREGEFKLSVRVYAGPTFPLDSIVLPPAPAVATAETTFVVAGEQPPEEEMLRNFRIASYSKDGGTPVTAPGTLELEVGDRCRVNLSYEHQGPSVVGKLHAAIWQRTALDPHDEILHAEQSFSVAQSDDWQSFQDSIDIIITSKISPGSQYGLYCKLMGITGGDVFTPYLADVITIVGAPPSEADIRNFDIQVQGGTYDLGDTVSFTAPYEYKGKAQGGRLTISLGTGVYPSFTTKYTFSSISVNFEESADWVSKTLSGNFKLPTNLEPGQTYSVRAKLETNDGKQETDTDWGVIKITGIPVPPTSDIRNFDIQAQGGTYDLGASVPFTAPYEYKGKAQGGSLIISLGTGVYPTFTTKYTFPSKSVIFQESMDWASGQLQGSFTLPAGLEPGQTYSVRAKLETADGKQETDTDWGVIKITSIPVPPTSDIRNFDIQVQGGTYDLGASVPFTAPYEYKGKAQGGSLIISLGTGVYPTFTTKYTFPSKSVTFQESMDWASGQLQGSFTLPATLEVGQTYSVRAKLETNDGKQETDTDWGVIKVKEYVPPPPPPEDVGILFFTPHDEPIDYVEWCVEWAPDTGAHYISEWRGKGFMVIVKNPVTGGGVPLTGRGYAWLWPGAGAAIKYGPTPRYKLEDGTLYEFSVAYAEIYEK